MIATIAATAEQARLVATATDEQARAVTALVQANSHVRKTSHEVKKAMSEQARAARDILKAAQSTKEQASQVRKATQQQVKTAAEIAKAAGFDAPRRREHVARPWPNNPPPARRIGRRPRNCIA
jgi:methyl-accepting chemotaxis protein